MQQNMMGQNIIITESSSNLRELGRNALRGKWKTAILAVLVSVLCMQIPCVIFDALFGVNFANLYSDMYGYQYGVNVDIYNQIYNSMPSYSFLSGIYTLLVKGAFSLGIMIFFLALFRKQIVAVTDIFLGFERFGKALGMLLFQGLFIFLWALIGVAVFVLANTVIFFSIGAGIFLMVVGLITATVLAIIASIRYSQAFFVLADDPDMGIRDCVNESKAMMKGNKGKYFLLSLSFIGWAILAGIPEGIVVGIAEGLQVSGVALAILNVIASLFTIPVSVYLYSTYAGFYEILSGHLIKETEPAPLDPTAIPVSTPPQQPNGGNIVQQDSAASRPADVAPVVSEAAAPQQAPQRSAAVPPVGQGSAAAPDVAEIFKSAEAVEPSAPAVNPVPGEAERETAQSTTGEDATFDFIPREVIEGDDTERGGE